ncbi:MAG: antibiotic biosynthesis monooxygenase [Planctomycetes bacterium]|nr:antibiotic biosynthesis monooxygenase [Planctomycetota bacterium]
MKTRIAAAILLGPVTLFWALPASDGCDKATAKQEAKQNLAKGFPDLEGALKATPGCLGVESAKTRSGKQVIFAWFEDKKAVLKWYNSDTHKDLMKKFFPDQEYHKPLRDVPDDSGPIMAIASVTLAAKPAFKETQLPISQIAIELYQPMSGGIFLGGRFAPKDLKVPKMRDYSPKAE